MGYLKTRHKMQILGKTPEGTCPICATAHGPAQPHNQQSLCYQYKFYDEHGRWPTWKDAMDHCPEDVKQLWQQALEEKGVDIDGSGKQRTANRLE